MFCSSPDARQAWAKASKKKEQEQNCEVWIEHQRNFYDKSQSFTNIIVLTLQLDLPATTVDILLNAGSKDHRIGQYGPDRVLYVDLVRKLFGLPPFEAESEILPPVEGEGEILPLPWS